MLTSTSLISLHIFKLMFSRKVVASVAKLSLPSDFFALRMLCCSLLNALLESLLDKVSVVLPCLDGASPGGNVSHVPCTQPSIFQAYHRQCPNHTSHSSADCEGFYLQLIVKLQGSRDIPVI